MGAPKQKWTPEEEAALRAGVDKYGPGKWRAIQKDEEFGPCLMTRSNVDLKDKWRNMSVSANGFGSRDRGSKALALKMGTGTRYIGPTISLPSASGSESKAIVLYSAPVKDKKSLGPRYDNLIMEAILCLEEPNGSSKSQIATYIEDHNSVPSNFRNLLNQKLKFLTLQGKLIKMRQNYIVSETFELSTEEKISKLRPRKDSHSKQHNTNIDSQEDEGKQTRRFPRGPLKKMRSDVGATRKMKTNLDATMVRTMTAAEAARIAAQAVAEAEAAAAAAEEAARAAELAEAEWEAAEAAAEAATTAFALKSPKKFKALPIVQEEVAVTG